MRDALASEACGRTVGCHLEKVSRSGHRHSGGRPQEMTRVESLRARIILQFLAVLTPFALVLGGQAWFDQRRASTIERSLYVRQLSLEAQAAYGTFVNGVVDSVDRNYLGPSAVAGLERTSRALRGIESADPG